jgi:cellulose synthase/poly-beta-1,6-N-acetylglucosamine synthase-like glycosyltransferase
LLHNPYDYLLLWSLAAIWLVILINNVLVTGGFLCYLKHAQKNRSFVSAADLPFVSVLIPAHNEAKVIRKTLEAILGSDYDKAKYEIIVINDNSSDNSAEILEEIKNDHPGRMVTIINTDKITGGKGKSNALNIGLAQSKGALIAIYDADNTPEKNALSELVHSIMNDHEAGAVIGKFRCRNRNRNLFTRFINIEGLYFQWMAQAGRWQLLKLCTIPGTNFIIRRSILDKLGGWDTDAITEDTEISFRIYRLGYHIRFCPYSASWEQEPETLAVWLKQRKRWVKGNYYVLIKNFMYLFDSHAGPVRFDLLYFLAVYVLFLSSSVISDMIFILGFGGFIQTTILGYSLLLWVMAYLLFILSVLIALSAEKGELKLSNVFITMIMYFSYCKLWSLITVIGLASYTTDFVFKRQITWYKTERF